MGNEKRREPLHPMSPALIADMTGEHEIKNPTSLTVEKTVDAILQGDYETILLETDEAEHDVVPAVPKTIQRHLKLNNRGRGIRTELILYEEGFIKVSQERRGKRTAEQLLNLRYLDSRPTISRFVAMKPIYVGLGFTGAGALFGALVYFKLFLLLTLPATVMFVTAAVIAFLLSAYQTQEESSFCTMTGRGEVLALRATFGCIRALRKLVPELVDAIHRARTLNVPKREHYLREEMREHYRLQDEGILSKDHCLTSTRRILSSFE